ncbi:hypothetical protein Tco_0401016, partial [Tanacetum coccineum]
GWWTMLWTVEVVALSNCDVGVVDPVSRWYWMAMTLVMMCVFGGVGGGWHGSVRRLVARAARGVCPEKREKRSGASVIMMKP